MIWDVLIDRKGVNRIQTELLLRKAQSGDTGALDTLITSYYAGNSHPEPFYGYMRLDYGCPCPTSFHKCGFFLIL